MEGLKRITLENLGSGGAVEQFNHAFRQALRNIADPNTDPKAKRVVVLEVVIVPDEGGESAAVGYKVTSKLPGLRPGGTMIYLTEDDEGPVAVGRDTRQIDAFADADAEGRTQFPRIAGGGAS